MPSGLRVTRIDRVPAGTALELVVNGQALGRLTNRTTLDITVASGGLLVEVMSSGQQQPQFQMMQVISGFTATVLVGRCRNFGLLEARHYLEVAQPLRGLPDRTIHPLNLSAHSAEEWIQQKRLLGEPLSKGQMVFLQSLQPAQMPCAAPGNRTVPSLAELGAFSALGLEPEASEADVREAFRLLVSIHTPETGQPNETIHRLEEAFRIALGVVARRVKQKVSELGR
jgi:hypothetical protein